MILQVGSYFRNTKIEDSIYDNRYNMIDMRERSEEKGYSLLFVTNGKGYYRTTTKTFLPTYRIISNGPTIIYPKYYRKRQSFEKIIDGCSIIDAQYSFSKRDNRVNVGSPHATDSCTTIVLSAESCGGTVCMGVFVFSATL